MCSKIHYFTDKVVEAHGIFAAIGISFAGLVMSNRSPVHAVTLLNKNLTFER